MSIQKKESTFYRRDWMSQGTVMNVLSIGENVKGEMIAVIGNGGNHASQNRALGVSVHHSSIAGQVQKGRQSRQSSLREIDGVQSPCKIGRY